MSTRDVGHSHSMTTKMSIVAIVVGCCTEIVAALGTDFYTANGVYAPSDKRAPTWAGRLMFAVVGAIFIIVGGAHLILS